MKPFSALLAAAALAGVPGATRAQARSDSIVPHSTVLAGRVRDPLGHPLRAATVLAEERGLSTIVTDSGTFSLRNIPSGKTSFTVMRIGYAPVTFDIAMPPDTTVFVDVHLQPVTTLADVKVTGKALSPSLAKTGFYEREKVGLGVYLHPEDLAKLKFPYASQFLYEVPNVFVRKQRGIGYSIMMPSTQGGLCVPPVFIDGVINKAPLDESIDPDAVYAIEVYVHGAQIPASLNVALRSTGCGVVAIWTKAYER